MKKTIITSIALAAVLSFNAGAATETVTINSKGAAKSYFDSAIYQDLNITSTTVNTVDVSKLWEEKENDSNNHFAITATLNVDALKNYIGSTASSSLANIFTIQTSSSTFGLAAGVSTGVNGLVGSYEKETGWDYNYLFNATYTTSNPQLHALSSIDMSTITSAAVTFSNEDKTGITTFLTLIDAENAVTTLYGRSNGLRSSTNGLGALESITFDTSFVTSLSLMEDNCQSNAGYVNEVAISEHKLAAVPEPATATLSLLALAGLAARRRRK